MPYAARSPKRRRPSLACGIRLGHGPDRDRPGDITTVKVDAIVNAANSASSAAVGWGDPPRRRTGVARECRELRRSTLPDGLPPGDAVATHGHQLKARWVIHTVGLNRHAGQTDPDVLRRCFTSSLALARGFESASIAFPASKAGVYGWNVAEVAAIALDVAGADIARRGPG